MLILDGDAVRRVLPPASAIDVAREALIKYSRAQVRQPQRTMLALPEAGVLAVMPAQIPGNKPREVATEAAADVGGGLGVKVITIFPANPARGLPAHAGVVLLFDPDTGAPEALVDGGSVTALRTAAVSAVATAALARPDADVLAVLGSGVQARSHLEAVSLVRDLREVRIWSRNPDHAEAFAEWTRVRSSARVLVAQSPQQAVATAGIVCTTTASPEPLICAADIAPGTHVNAIGASFPNRRELSTDLVQRCAVFVDGLGPALAEAGDLLLAFPDVAQTSQHVRAEIGTVLSGMHPGRQNSNEVTLFKSVGLAVEDILAGAHIVAQARALGGGFDVPYPSPTGEPGAVEGPGPSIVASERT